MRRDDAAGPDLDRRRALVDGRRRAARRRRPGRARAGPDRCARCAARTTRRGRPAGGRGWRSSSRSSIRMSSSRSPRARLRRDAGAQPLELRQREGDRQLAGVDEAAVDLLGGGDAPDLGHRPERLALGLQHGRRRRGCGVDGRLRRDERRHPAAVAAGRPEAGDLALHHHHAQVGLLRLQVVRRPQPGEPGADDADVALPCRPAAPGAARASRADRRATGCARGTALRGRSRRPVYWRPVRCRRGRRAAGRLAGDGRRQTGAAMAGRRAGAAWSPSAVVIGVRPAVPVRASTCRRRRR